MGPRNNHCNGKKYHHKFAVNVQTGWHASKAYSSTSLLFSHGTGEKTSYRNRTTFITCTCTNLRERDFKTYKSIVAQLGIRCITQYDSHLRLGTG